MYVYGVHHRLMPGSELDPYTSMISHGRSSLILKSGRLSASVELRNSLTSHLQPSWPGGPGSLAPLRNTAETACTLLRFASGVRNWGEQNAGGTVLGVVLSVGPGVGWRCGVPGIGVA